MSDATHSALDWEVTFRDNTKHLELAPDCAESWVKRARLIMLDDHPENHPDLTLDQAEECILKAPALDSEHLEAIEEAAHFYEVMVPDPTKATLYAIIEDSNC
jgi:hypothetical protein